MKTFTEVMDMFILCSAYVLFLNVTSSRLELVQTSEWRDEGNVLRRMADHPLPAERQREKQKNRWKNSRNREIWGRPSVT